MSKIFFALYRNPLKDFIADPESRVRRMQQHITSDFNINDCSSTIESHGLISILSHSPSIKSKALNIITGNMTRIMDNDDYESIYPGANFQIRTNDVECRISVNLSGSRSIWYYFDKDKFLVSGSQRMLVMWLSNFEADAQAVSWMLSAGNLGPGYSWDKRLKHLRAGEQITLDRRSWEIKSVLFKPYSENTEENKRKLRDLLESELESAFSNIDFDLQNTVLTLSGGYDSRTVLYYLTRRNFPVPTITWGLNSVAEEADTDSLIAREVAKRMNVKNRYFTTDFKDRSFDFVFDRFLKAGEGRIDHINSFMDGLRMWDTLYETGVRNVIRAEETFGWLPCQNEQDVRISLDINKMEDNANMSLLQEFGLESQIFPEFTWKKSSETNEMWRDRLYREFRIPYVLTALHTIINPYVEVYNPLLNNNLVSFCTTIPDAYRTSKKLYTELVHTLMPDLRVARRASIPEPATILKSSRIVSLLLDELSSTESKLLFGNDFILWMQNSLKVNDKIINSTHDRLSLWIKSQIPWRVKKLLRRDFIKYKADFNQLAFRASIIIRMHRMLKTDAKVLN